MKYLAGLIIISILGIAVYAIGASSKPPQKAQNTTSGTEIDTTQDVDKKEEPINPFEYSSLIDTPKGPLEIFIMKDEIIIGSSETYDRSVPVFRTDLSLTKEKYPELFQQGIANLSSISTKLVKLPGGKFKVEVSNNAPDHGTLAPQYLVLVDPISGVIEENTHPSRDFTLSLEENEYLKKYPYISELIGNSILDQLIIGKLNFGDFKLESLITVPITNSYDQTLYIFDKDTNYVTEEGFDMVVKAVGNTIEVKFHPSFIGTEAERSVVKVIHYSVDSQTKIITKIKEKKAAYDVTIWDADVQARGKMTTLDELFGELEDFLFNKQAI